MNKNKRVPQKKGNCCRRSTKIEERALHTYNSTLSNIFQPDNGAKHDFKGATQHGYGPEMWGLTLQQIKDIVSNPCIGYETSMRDVVELVIKPATKGLGVGYALLVNQEKPLKAKVMVSVSSSTAITLHMIFISNQLQFKHSLTLSSIYHFLFYY